MILHEEALRQLGALANSAPTSQQVQQLVDHLAACGACAEYLSTPEQQSRAIALFKGMSALGSGQASMPVSAAARDAAVEYRTFGIQFLGRFSSPLKDVLTRPVSPEDMGELLRAFDGAHEAYRATRLVADIGTAIASVLSDSEDEVGYLDLLGLHRQGPDVSVRDLLGDIALDHGIGDGDIMNVWRGFLGVLSESRTGLADVEVIAVDDTRIGVEWVPEKLAMLSPSAD